MKKTIVILTLLALLLTSCQSPLGQSPAQTGFWADPGEPETGVTWTPETGEENFEMADAGFHSLEEYETYIKSARLPANFIYYEDLAAFGSFHNYLCFGEPDSIWFYYTYEIKDSAGHIIQFAIHTQTQNQIVSEQHGITKEYRSVEHLPSDLRRADNRDKFYVNWQGVDWYYHQGKLFYIHIYYDGLFIAVNADDGYLAEYEIPRDNPTFMSRLLTKSEAPTALSEFAAALTASSQAEG